MTGRTRALLASVLGLLVFGAATFAVNLAIAQGRAQVQHENCLQDQRQYDALHRVIAEAYKPNGGGTSALKPPPETPPWFFEILRQLDTPPTAPAAHVYKALGPRPSC